jgi:DNA-binding transcriptional regulator YiaG
MSGKALSRELEVDSKTISNWRMGRYHANPDAVSKMKKLADKMSKQTSILEVLDVDYEEAGEAAEEEAPEEEEASAEEAPEETPIYARNVGVRRMIKRLKINQREFADLLSTSQAVVSGWVRNASSPSPKFHARLGEIWENAFEGKAPVKPQKKDASKKPRKNASAIVLRKPLAAAPLLEMSTEFYALYRAERNRRDVDAILSFVSEKSGVDAATLRQLVAVILLTLKKEMDVEEIYKCLTGHK